MIFKRNSSVREQPYIVEPAPNMKPTDTLPKSTSATTSAIIDAPATLHGTSASGNNQLNVPANARRLSRGGNRSVKCIGTDYKSEWTQ